VESSPHSWPAGGKRTSPRTRGRKDERVSETSFLRLKDGLFFRPHRGGKKKKKSNKNEEKRKKGKIVRTKKIAVRVDEGGLSSRHAAGEVEGRKTGKGKKGEKGTINGPAKVDQPVWIGEREKEYLLRGPWVEKRRFCANWSGEGGRRSRERKRKD